MQGFKTLVFLAVVVALLGLASAAPAEDESFDLEQLQDVAGVEQTPAMLVRLGLAELSVPEERRCTASNCRAVCRALGWRNGRCVNANTCQCFN